MKEPADTTLLSVDAIKEALRLLPCIPLTDIKVHNCISSTIDLLQEQPVVPGELSVCLAEQQTHGRGRLGRKWYSPYAANIYLSLKWLSKQELAVFAKLSLVAGLALIKVLEQLGIKPGLKIKWPNDVLWNDRKLAGILVELSTKADGFSQVVISLGLNVNMLPASDSLAIAIDQPWISLQQIFTYSQDRNKIVAMLLREFYEVLKELETEGWNKILRLWPQYDALYGRNIQFNVGEETRQGVALGINEQGHLQVRNQQREIITCVAGEVQLCKDSVKQ